MREHEGVSSDLFGTIEPLPRGPHDLSREHVETTQRLRLAAAMADACADRGYAATSVSAVLRRAGVSRLTFYDLYDNKLACFLDALALVSDALVAELEQGTTDDGRPGPVRAVAALDHYLDTMGRNLAFARLHIVEAHAAGPVAVRQRAALHDRIANALADLLGAEDEQRRFECRAYVAAVSALVTVPVATGDVGALRALRDPLVALLRRLDDLDRGEVAGEAAGEAPT